MWFPKTLQTQYSLIAILEKWKSTVYKGKHAGYFLRISQKHCHNKFMIDKLEAYGFSHSSLSDGLFRNSTFSTWEKL